jgi:hypothetical protein
LIEPQARLSVGSIRAMAMKAAIGQQRSDVTVEVDLVGADLPLCRDSRQAGQNSSQHPAYRQVSRALHLVDPMCLVPDSFIRDSLKQLFLRAVASTADPGQLSRPQRHWPVGAST